MSDLTGRGMVEIVRELDLVGHQTRSVLVRGPEGYFAVVSSDHPAVLGTIEEVLVFRSDESGEPLSMDDVAHGPTMQDAIDHLELVLRGIATDVATSGDGSTLDGTGPAE